MPCAQVEDSGLLGLLQSLNWVKVCLVSTGVALHYVALTRSSIACCYMDDVSRVVFFSRTLGLLKPDAADKFGHVLDIITQTGAVRVTRLRMCRLNREQAMVLYKQHAGERYLKYEGRVCVCVWVCACVRAWVFACVHGCLRA